MKPIGPSIGRVAKDFDAVRMDDGLGASGNISYNMLDFK